MLLRRRAVAHDGCAVPHHALSLLDLPAPLRGSVRDLGECRAADFAFVAGTPARIASSRRAERTFCDRCGTPLTFQLHASPEELDVTVCSMDHPERIAPEDHTQTLTQLPWIRLADGLPRHETERPPLQA